ncbi:uncharacterized protein LOC116108137 [Pistacia vera]|uniref:uncharacterized protein LOC116108137 n=1 Tax=Pistacia vera TaxID=55513 RepID=UPI001263634C|nr:uncharacterized protein LOC116108137 [Pistacia vera]
MSSLSYLDPRSKQCEQEVQQIMHLQNVANQLLYAFTDSKRVTISHIPVANALIWIDVPEGQLPIANESKTHLKCGRPVGSKDKNPRKKIVANYQDVYIKEASSHEENRDIFNHKTPEEVQNVDREKIDQNGKTQSRQN